jgi:hypothetical protein
MSLTSKRILVTGHRVCARIQKNRPPVRMRLEDVV